MKNIWLEGMMGLVIGDALGLPVQFIQRNELKKNPVTTMSGFGTYDMPPGTWSDDSSMAVATLSGIQDKQTIDLNDIMIRFGNWLMYGEYTPFGEAFDIGNTCLAAINRYAITEDVYTCGMTGEWANGNGALMRIMPMCLFAYEKVKRGEWPIKDALENIHQVSALTHNHLRSKIACGMYYFMVSNIIDGEGSLLARLQNGVNDAMQYYHEDTLNYVELAYYERLFYLDKFADCKEEKIKSSGYVVDSLEAAIWSLITTNSFKEALLKAVNLGDDTDTVGAIAGGLAGLYYGYESVPEEWKEQIIKAEEIIALCELMEEK